MSIYHGHQCRSPIGQVRLFPHLNLVDLMAVEDYDLPKLLELMPIGKQLWVMEMVNIGVQGPGRFVYLFAESGHAGQSPAGGLSHPDHMDTGGLIALSALYQIDLVSGLAQRDTLLMKDPDIPGCMGTSHMTDFDHSFSPVYRLPGHPSRRGSALCRTEICSAGMVSERGRLHFTGRLPGPRR